MEISKKRYTEIRSVVDNIYTLIGTKEPFSITKALGINCSVIPLEGLLGVSDILPTNGQSTIFLSSALGSYGKRIVCAHELGHICLHNGSGLNFFTAEGNENDLLEYEANIFAIELMPHLKPANYFHYSRGELQSHLESKIRSNIYDI